jgi:hypothetical protein
VILPEGFDLNRPDDELIEELVASGAHTREQAEDLVAMLRDGEPVLE